MANKCNYPGCRTQIHPETWACNKHWFMLPGNLRRKINSTFNPKGNPSRIYLDACLEACEHIYRTELDSARTPRAK